MNFHHFVLANGRDFQPCENPAQWIKRRGRIGNCYKNAFLLVLEHPKDLRYAEGYAARMEEGHPIICKGLHAWAVTKDGEVVDPTWKNGVEYFGVAFEFEQVRQVMMRNQDFSGVIDDVAGGWPLLKGG